MLDTAFFSLFSDLYEVQDMIDILPPSDVFSEIALESYKSRIQERIQEFKDVYGG